MTEQVTKVSFGIVAFSRPDALATTLAATSGRGLDVIVANVGADPRVAAVVAEHPAVRVVEMANRGFAAAVNAIANVAAGDVVVFANDDAALDGDAVERLGTVVDAGAADVAVPRVLTSDGQTEPTIAAVPSLGALTREWLLLPDRPVPVVRRRGRVEKWRMPTVPERIDAASAVVVAVRRDLLLAEPLPEDYFLYWEESEWFWHLRERGAVVQYRPDIECRHDGGRSDVRPEKSRLLARNAVRCVRRTQGRTAGLAAIVVVVAWNVRLVAADLARVLVRPSGDGRARVRARWCGLAAALTSWGELR